MAVRVVVGADAAGHARQFVALAGRLGAAVRALETSSAGLAQESSWSGAAASRFRQDRRRMAALLERMTPAVERMARGAQSVIDDIDRADAGGAAAMPPAGAATTTVGGPAGGAAPLVSAAPMSFVVPAGGPSPSPSGPTPDPRPGPAPRQGPELSDGVWDLVPAPMNLSGELWSAYDYTAPYVDPDGTKYSRRADAVLSWIEDHRDVIVREADRQGVSPKAIAAVIAWEALQNVQPKLWPFPPGSTVGGVPLSNHWAGPGKVHIDSRLVQQVEERGYLPKVSHDERVHILADDEGSIRYIAAIMHAIADATNRVPEYRHLDAAQNVPLLAQVYQGGGAADDLQTWEDHLRGNQGRDLQFQNDMAKWVAEHADFVDQAIRPWQPGDGPPPRRQPPAPQPGPSPTPG